MITTDMAPVTPNTLLCTVGTSLFFPNLEDLKARVATRPISPDLKPLATAYKARQWTEVAKSLNDRAASERLCGAEINSVSCMIERNYVANDVGLHFFCSATDEGRSIGSVLRHYFRNRGHRPVHTVVVPGLQDDDPQKFCKRGMRNLFRKMQRVIADNSPQKCAINATGGFKAQIAVAVLLGQATDVPVYYKHERFNEMISFPPAAVHEWLD